MPTRLAAAVATASAASRNAGALHQVGADLHHGPHHRGDDRELVQPVGPQAGHDDGQQHASRSSICADHRAPRTPGDAPVEPEDEHQLETRFGRGRDGQHDERAASCRAGRKVADQAIDDELERHADAR